MSGADILSEWSISRNALRTYRIVYGRSLLNGDTWDHLSSVHWQRYKRCRNRNRAAVRSARKTCPRPRAARCCVWIKRVLPTGKTTATLTRRSVRTTSSLRVLSCSPLATNWVWRRPPPSARRWTSGERITLAGYFVAGTRFISRSFNKRDVKPDIAPR